MVAVKTETAANPKIYMIVVDHRTDGVRPFSETYRAIPFVDLFPNLRCHPIDPEEPLPTSLFFLLR